MNPMRVATVGCVAIALLGLAEMAGAQARSFRDLQGLRHNGDRVTITDPAGIVTNGRLITFSNQSLRLMVQSAGPIEVSESSVAKIELMASRARKGALVGLIAGSAVGALAVALTPPCSRFCVGPKKGVAILPVAGIVGGIGAGLGALIGAKFNHRLIYLGPIARPTRP